MEDLSNGILSLAQSRTSAYCFDESRLISPQDIHHICEAGRWTPSCYGEEPWTFIICNKHKDLSFWEKAYDSLVPGNQAWAQYAPLLIICTAVTHFEKDKLKNKHADYDTGAAAMAMCLQAQALGISSHQMGGFDAQKVKNLFSIPNHNNVLSIIAMGYKNNDESIFSEEILMKEKRKRNRKPMEKTFLETNWPKEEKEAENAGSLNSPQPTAS